MMWRTSGVDALFLHAELGVVDDDDAGLEPLADLTQHVHGIVQHVGATDLDCDVGKVLRLTPLPVGFIHHGAISPPIGH